MLRSKPTCRTLAAGGTRSVLRSKGLRGGWWKCGRREGVGSGAGIFAYCPLCALGAFVVKTKRFCGVDRGGKIHPKCDDRLPPCSAHRPQPLCRPTSCSVHRPGLSWSTPLFSALSSSGRVCRLPAKKPHWDWRTQGQTKPTKYIK